MEALTADEIKKLINACEFSARICNANAVNAESFFKPLAIPPEKEVQEIRSIYFALETDYYNLRDKLRELYDIVED